jgi:hypothetical protein
MSDETFVVIDFETSGRKVRRDGGDHIFGFGVAIGHLAAETRMPVIDRSYSVGIRPCATPPTTAAGWRELWRERGWDMSACDEFWIGTDDAAPRPLLATLNALFVPADKHRVVDSYAEAASLLNSVLGAAEPYTLIVDCICFDPWLANLLLVEHGFEPLTHTRAGRYRWGTYDEDSMLLNRADVHLLPRSREIADAQTAVYFVGAQIGAHNPRWDAVNILCRTLVEMMVLNINV